MDLVNPRLKSFLGVNSDVIEKEVTMLDPKAMKLVRTHYSSLSFNSKPDQYWCAGESPNTFYAHVFKWCMIAGIMKDNLPDGIEIGLMRDSLLASFPYMNENSVLDAIHRNMAGEFEERVKTYNTFNCKYLYDVLFQYDKHLRKAHTLAAESKTKHAPAVESELSEVEIEQKNIEAMRSVFEQYKSSGNKELISGNYYEFLDKKIKFQFTPEQKWEFMRLAKDELVRIKASGETLHKVSEVMKGIESGEKKDDLKILAMKLAVINYFDSIQTLPL